MAVGFQMSILSAISTGWGIARDLLGRQDAKRANADAQNQRRHQIRTLVKDAREAGIHPLAALGSQVAGNYGSTGGMVYSGDATGDALRGWAGKEQSSLETEHLRLRNEALRADIRRTDVDTARLVADATSRSSIARATASTRGKDVAGNPLSPNLASGGITFSPSPLQSDIQLWQNRLGEPAEWALFPVAAGLDVGNTIKHRLMGGVGWGRRSGVTGGRWPVPPPASSSFGGAP